MKPWIGQNYEQTNPRILILGESLYGKPKRNDNLKKMINDVIDTNYAFFTKIQNIFSNPEHWESVDGVDYQLNKNIFWNDVAFYEYIQEVLSEPKEKVPLEYWEKAKKPFKEVLKTLEPDIVIVLGYETFYNLPEEGEEGKTYKTKKEMPTWKCQLESKTIHFCGIQHPSSFGFSNEPWQNNFEAFLKDNFNIEYD